MDRACRCSRVDLVAAGLVIRSVVGLIVCVIVGGLLLGILNTVLTESVMEATDLPRAVASSAYSGVRFLGGAIAPPAATLLAATFTAATPFYAAAISVLVATALIMIGHRHLKRVDGVEESLARRGRGAHRRELSARQRPSTGKSCSKAPRRGRSGRALARVAVLGRALARRER